MPTILISPLSTIAEVAVRRGVREMVSLVAETQFFHRPGIIDPARHLVVGVNDIVFADKEGLVAPEDRHVASLIAFAKGWDTARPLLVHCWMGVSRSPAAALTIALATEPALDETMLAEQLRVASPQASPNTRIIEIADRLLGRDGRLIAAVERIGRGSDYQGDAPFEISF